MKSSLLSMTKESLAAMLNGREYRSEITEDEESKAKAAGLVVIFGYSDDNVELRGAISDEQGCYGGGTITMHNAGLLANHDDDCGCEFCGYDAASNKCAKVKLLWCVGGYSWTYQTKLPHATFEITEDGEKYCRGIVIDSKDLPSL